MSDTVFVTLKTTMGVSGARKVPNAEVEADAVTKITKQLFDSPELEAIRSFDGDTRRYLDVMTLPFESGVRMCPVAAIERVDRELRGRQEQRAALVETFITAYPRLLAEAQRRLTDVEISGRKYNLWNADDYTGPQEARAGFGMTYQFLTFDAPDVLRGINSVVFEEQREALANTIEDAKANANQLLCETAAELVKHLRERLEPTGEGKRKRLHETTITNLTEFLENLSVRNVTNNAELTAVCDELKAVLSNTYAGKLREGTDQHRQEIARELEKIEQQIDRDLIPVARRRIAYEAEPETAPAPDPPSPAPTVSEPGPNVSDLFASAEPDRQEAIA